MPRAMKWRSLSVLVRNARERMIQEAIGLREFVDVSKVAVRWLDGHTDYVESRREEQQRDPRLEIAHGRIRVFSDGALEKDPGAGADLCSRVDNWRKWLDCEVTGST